MKEGDVVLVAGKMDNRVREEASERIGTIVSISEDAILVLLENGNLWRGSRREVFPIEEQT